MRRRQARLRPGSSLHTRHSNLQCVLEPVAAPSTESGFRAGTMTLADTQSALGRRVNDHLSSGHAPVRPTAALRHLPRRTRRLHYKHMLQSYDVGQRSAAILTRRAGANTRAHTVGPIENWRWVGTKSPRVIIPGSALPPVLPLGRVRLFRLACRTNRRPRCSDLPRNIRASPCI